MGLDFNIPGNVKYTGSDQYKVKFFADQKFQLWDKFTEWTREVFEDENSTGNYYTPKASATITLLAVDNELNPVKKITLVGVVCRSVGELEYELADAGTLQSFDATFSYHFWVDSDV